MGGQVLSFSPSYSEKLKIIEMFSAKVAKTLVGGQLAGPNDPHGDLVHANGTYSEVKGAGESSGAIIRRKQLLEHCADDMTKNYILVFRKNRIWKDGRWVYMTLRKAKTRKSLDDFLFDSLEEICVVPKDAVKILYDRLKRRKREKRHNFRTSPKVYVKMRSSDLFQLVLAGFGRRSESLFLIIGSRKVELSVTTIYK